MALGGPGGLRTQKVSEHAPLAPTHETYTLEMARHGECSVFPSYSFQTTAKAPEVSILRYYYAVLIKTYVLPTE